MTEQTTQAVAIKTEQKEITITFNDVKRYLCPLASDAEIGLFLKICQSEGLNPFKKEVYLIKYAPDQAASIIIATEVFLKVAESCPEYNGLEAGIILKGAKGQLEFREGSFLLDDEEDTLVGGWAKAYRKDREKPIYAAVNIKEYRKFTKGGRVTRFWDEMPATMIRKVALSHALREAFPNRFAGTYTTAEVEELPEGELPPALEKGGKPDWKKFWARVKAEAELGLTIEEARLLLGVDSIKEERIDAGWTMEQIWDELIQRLRERSEEGEAAEEGIFRGEGEMTAEQAIEAPQPEVPQNVLFKTWGELAQAAYKLGVTPDQVFKRAKVKKWEDFADYREAWNVVTELVMERRQKPEMI